VKEVAIAFAAACVGIFLIVLILWEGFETIILPRRVLRRVRLTRLFYRSTWFPWSRFVNAVFTGQRLETFLSFYGPLSLLLLLTVWAGTLVLGFGLLYWAVGFGAGPGAPAVPFTIDLYVSGTTFFTLGLGDVQPLTPLARFLTVIEAGMGFGFLALLIAYLPGMNQSFSRREVTISMLDARAGSPSTALEMLRGHAHEKGLEELDRLFFEWEHWAAELLESHLSYPVLAYYRSQHDNQSWLGALTTILDTSALVLTSIKDACPRQAELTFAMARHAVVDLAAVFNLPPRKPERDRLPTSELAHLTSILKEEGLVPEEGPEAEHHLKTLRAAYEPYVSSLATFFCFSLPPWLSAHEQPADWQTSPWGKGPALKNHRL
jgi:hypothetical protein